MNVLNFSLLTFMLKNCNAEIAQNFATDTPHHIEHLDATVGYGHVVWSYGAL